ncbi:MAG: transcriptional regulator [bacterium]
MRGAGRPPRRGSTDLIQVDSDAATHLAGAVIPGTGGVRKLRWGLAGQGKRGGLRVIYYVRSQRGVIWMLTLYSKNVVENIPSHVLRQIRQELEDG